MMLLVNVLVHKFCVEKTMCVEEQNLLHDTHEENVKQNDAEFWCVFPIKWKIPHQRYFVCEYGEWNANEDLIEQHNQSSLRFVQDGEKKKIMMTMTNRNFILLGNV